MKKSILILSTVLVLVACNNEIPVNQNEGSVDASKVVFNFTVKHLDDTKAVKTFWEKGDKVFVFFNDVTTAHVTMVYDGTAWTYDLIGDAALSTSGKLTAVYPPFGNDLTASYSSGWTFSDTRYSYYLAATDVDFTISNVGNVNTLSATIYMNNPGGFAHFYVADDSASDGAYTLATDAVVPTGIAGVSSDGTISEIGGKRAGDAMEGYKYEGGYSFSGKVVDSYSNDYGANYYFIKTKVEDSSREDYFTSVSDTLTGRSAVSLPANGDAKWIAVGEGKWVDMGNTNVRFATCNYGCSVPEEPGNREDINECQYHGVCSKDEMSWVVDHCNWTWIKVKGRTGMVVKSKNGNGCMFLPAFTEWGWSWTGYWAPNPRGTHIAMMLEFKHQKNGKVAISSTTSYETYYYVRPVMNK